MKDISYLPLDYEALHVVETMQRLLTPEFNRHTDYDVLVLPRTLYGDHNGLALEISNYIQLAKEDCDEFTLDTFSDLVSCLSLSKQQLLAAKEIKSDLFQSQSQNPYLFIEGTHYGIGEGFSGWHFDDANEEDDMLSRELCSYNRTPTDFLKRLDALFVGGHSYKQRPGSQPWSPQMHDVTRHRLCTKYDEYGDPIATAHKRPKTSHSTIPGLLLNG